MKKNLSEKQKKKMRWYVQPMNAFSIQLIAEYLGLPAETRLEEKLTTEEKKVLVWEIEYYQLELFNFIRKTADMLLEFRSFSCKEGERKITPKPILSELRKKKPEVSQKPKSEAKPMKDTQEFIKKARQEYKKKHEKELPLFK